MNYYANKEILYIFKKKIFTFVFKKEGTQYILFY